MPVWKTMLIFTALCTTFLAKAQHLNLDFENPSLSPWFPVGRSGEYEVSLDQHIRFEGKQSLSIAAKKTTSRFGGVMLSLPHNLQGDSLEISAMIKLADVDTVSKVAFMLRIDPNLHFDDLGQQNIRGTDDWREYRIKVKLLPEQTTGLSIGIFLYGQGKIWADQVQIKVDGIDMQNASDRYIPFKTDFGKVKSSNVGNFQDSEKMQQRLADLCKIWGLLKYRHPEVAKGDRNWDQQLFTSIHAVAAAKNDTEVEQHYTALMDDLGSYATKTVRPEQAFQQQADYDWIKQLPFNQVLKDRLDSLRYADLSAHYYYRFNPHVGNVQITNEFGYEHLQHPDTGFRVLSLFRYWNIVQYFSPYRTLTDIPWTEVLQRYIPRMLAADDALKYQLATSAMLLETKDAHTQLWTQSSAIRQLLGERTIPIKLKYVEGKPLVTHAISVGETPTNLTVGDIIIRKDGKTPAEIQEFLRDIIPTPNNAVTQREMAVRLGSSTQPMVRLEIERNGEIIEVEQPTVAANGLRIPTTDTVGIKVRENGVVYINHAYLTKKDLYASLETILHAKGLIIDLRNYPKELVVFDLGSLLLNVPTAIAKFSFTSYKHPGDFKFTNDIIIKPSTAGFYAGKVAILVDETTQSRAEYHSMGYQTASLAKVFGSQTAGADGDFSQFTLPGGLYSGISGLGVFYPDGRETQRIGIVPDVEVHPTVNGVRNGRDEVLEKALEYVAE